MDFKTKLNYLEEGLNKCGFSLRSLLTLSKISGINIFSISSILSTERSFRGRFLSSKTRKLEVLFLDFIYRSLVKHYQEKLFARVPLLLCPSGLLKNAESFFTRNMSGDFPVLIPYFIRVFNSKWIYEIGREFRIRHCFSGLFFGIRRNFLGLYMLKFIEKFFPCQSSGVFHALLEDFFRVSNIKRVFTFLAHKN